MTKNERLELCELSRKVYGKAYAWQKMVEKGEKAPMEEILEDGTARKYTGIHYQTVEEVKKLMVELAKEEDELKTKQEAEALEQAAKIKENTGEMEISTMDHDPVIDVLETVGD